MTNAELADEIERMKRESGGRNQFALWLLTNVDEIIATLRHGRLFCSRCLIQVESRGDLREHQPSRDKVLVPREPTDAMKKAAASGGKPNYYLYETDENYRRAWCQVIYKDMLAAAEVEGRHE